MPSPIHASKSPAADARRWQRSVFVGAVIAAMCVGLTMVLAGAAWKPVGRGLAIEGGFLLLWLIAGLGWGSLLLTRVIGRGDGRPDDAHALRATRIALGLGVMGLIVLGLGLAGLLRDWSAWTLIVIGIAMGAAGVPRRAPVAIAPRAASWSWLWIAAIAPVAIVLLASFVPPGVLWGNEPHGYDVLEYHLQLPREWYEAGRIIPLRHNVFSNFPLGVEMHYLLAMHLRGGPWAGMYLAQLMHAAYVAAAVYAVYGVARMLTRDPRRATLAAVAAAATPWLALLAPVAYNEGGLLLYGTLAIGWAMAGMDRTPDDGGRFGGRALALSGLMTGLACGVKLTAFPVLLGGLLLGIAVAGRRPRRIARDFFWFALPAILVAAPWLIRTALWTKNPFFPEASAIFGQAHFNDIATERWRRATAAPPELRPPDARAGALWNEVLADWKFGYVLLPLSIMAAAASWPRSLVPLCALVTLSAFWLTLTHLQGRFFVMAVPPIALLIALAPWPRLAALLVAGTAVVGPVVIAPRLLDRVALMSALGLINSQDLTPLTPDAILTPPSDASIALVGDARIFAYQRPMSRLRYRTVFDADTSGGADVIDAWLGDPRDRRANETVVIDPVELRRLTRTYHAIPPLPDDVPGPRDRPFILGSMRRPSIQSATRPR